MATPSVTLASLQDTTHDYYIHPNENPSLVLISPILEGHNYHGWARSMSMALQMKNNLVLLMVPFLVQLIQIPWFQHGSVAII
ncbi:hypothetical protein VIGAN_08277900 [Vigna angularis var. angularis]|uniref:Retrotransposon Copia-like N-terminal domain-containing protein n=1 Tax=Vigna angularis var. angularis TaxID=157739 RepID=A0A0S3ST03_PHAAN|nr:hypothetical protein VIGAN_08277900 [Vigna angularis var. angularis]